LERGGTGTIAASRTGEKITGGSERTPVAPGVLKVRRMTAVLPEDSILRRRCWFGSRTDREGAPSEGMYSWEEIESHIRRMDGSSLSSVAIYIDQPEDVRLIVSGGNSGLFMCHATYDDDYWFLLDPSLEDSGPVTITVAELLEKYDLSVCHDVETAVRAARVYFEAARLDPSSCWEANSRPGRRFGRCS
jgi:hypothetical protein